MKQDGTWPLVTAERMRALDAYTIDTLGVSADALMESAGRAVVDALLSSCAAERAAPGAEVLVVCGTGNNGGDGWVVARHLAQLGQSVRAVSVGSADGRSPTCGLNFERARSAGVRIEEGMCTLPSRGVLVDALFGTGLSRDVKGEAAAWVERMNESRRNGLKVVAVDVPSGLQSETGQVLGAAVVADLTVTIGCTKLGLVLEPGRTHAGQIWVARIGIADELPEDDMGDAGSCLELWSRRGAAERLPRRPAAGHKGRFGHVLLVAGSEGKTGAAALAATAALRAGAGLVTLGCPRSLNPLLEAKCTEVMTTTLEETADASLSHRASPQIVELAHQRDVVGLGPGIGTHPETRTLVLDLVGALAAPLVIDADGLNALQGELPRLLDRTGPTLLTPHPGEAARLLETTAAEINADRLGAARELAARSGATVVLKGAGTITANPAGHAVINPTGGPYLASAGTGDVLTGVLAALIGQGLQPFEAGALAAYLHGAAADGLASRRGTTGILAGEIAEELPACMETLRTERGSLGRSGRNSESVASTLLPFPDA